MGFKSAARPPPPPLAAYVAQSLMAHQGQYVQQVAQANAYSNFMRADYNRQDMAYANPAAGFFPCVPEPYRNRLSVVTRMGFGGRKRSAAQ